MDLRDLTIFLRTYHEEGMHGDRATKKTPYKRYEVWINNERAEMVARTFDPYNHRDSAIGHDRYQEARAYANQLSNFLGDAKVEYEDYHKQVTETWQKKA